MALQHKEEEQAEEEHKQRHHRHQVLQEDNNIDTRGGTPIRYLPLCHVYSATSPCVSASGSSNVMSKKVKARKLVIVDPLDGPDQKPPLPPPPPPSPVQQPPLTAVYSRRHKRTHHSSEGKCPAFFDSLMKRPELPQPAKSENLELSDGDNCEKGCVEPDDVVVESNKVERVLKKKRRRIGNSELVKLGVDSSTLHRLDRPRLRESRNHSTSSVSRMRDRPPSTDFPKTSFSGSDSTKRWTRLDCEGVDPKTFVGLQCKVYWPLDDDWYAGRVIGYNLETNRHHVEYEDGDAEDLIILNEKIKFYVSRLDMQHLKLRCGTNSTDNDELDYSEMVVLAASLDDCQELEPGDIIWAKITGHAMWPAIVVDESLMGTRKVPNRMLGGKSVPVQFFGTHDFARVTNKQAISFLRGLLSSFHLKCKKPRFLRSLEEAKTYLSEQKLPGRMLQLQNGTEDDDCESASEDEGSIHSHEEGDDEIHRSLEGLRTFPFQIGDLEVKSLGKIVKDSEYFQDGQFIWPEGYTAVRKFTSATDPSACALYKMEVLRDAESKFRPLFRVTLDNGVQFEGSTPSGCWTKIYRKIKKMQNSSSDGATAGNGAARILESGSDMFGFSNPEVLKLIQELSHSRLTSKFSVSKSTSGKYRDLLVNYRPVRVDWKDLDKCSVCHMDEEYENNLFLQCDKCRMMVHARCYGELEPVDGVLWLCNLCRPGAPDSTPPCCLCPVIGGAMKPTTDGRWAHLACAIWVPETCLSDIKKMEPIDGLSRINKDRWKLLCSICGVPYGACIQCSNSTCRVAYHPLCARAAGLCVELEDEDRLHLISVDDDDEDQCIRLLSFCKKHRQPSNERSVADERIGLTARQCSNYTPPSNPSGCARTEPYNYFGRRGRKEPEALAAASLKRLFVENRPYLVSGYCQHECLGSPLSTNAVKGSRFPFRLPKLKASELDAPKNILSVAEKYTHMRKTFRKRLAFGKSGIHGFGIFAKHPHKAGDMVIEYAGELVRPPIADRREHFIYNSLVGAGTYMFRIDDERVIDATRAGSIAHLINHSCEPNCYSRVISVNGDEHIIIFAKRDIKQWEELTYDYRCRGVVNDIEAEERAAKLYAPRSELIDWRGE
ncbi:histone-lysine N-methyltransferase ATX2 isoform X2 [Malania oleifera]|uniref:histone-lysine N-methyltransferase ATX2 isoform X2 n=1 Tax=Malania oleifera TaxID=397392 RepID=UPI0025AE7034|nr:histone-lysine N-methyltransferase ATX2 isoform X2 [Malania oleifera]